MQRAGNAHPDALELSQERRIAISRWDDEGGSPCRPQAGLAIAESDVPDLANAELAQLHVRVIALENLVVALLVDASDGQLARAREMASYICPRPGFTRHPATIRAASLMVRLLERAKHFRFKVTS
jgi:hypothetical protein